VKHVLIVDDDINVATLLQKRLEAAGYRVSSAPDGIAGLKAIREYRPDLVILDVMMPGLDGYSLVREIKADDACKNIPLMVVTAKGDLSDLFRMEGISAIVEKPFKVEDILGKIRALTE
jgi:two-component system OmpR family response regulator